MSATVRGHREEAVPREELPVGTEVHEVGEPDVGAREQRCTHCGRTLVSYDEGVDQDMLAWWPHEEDARYARFMTPTGSRAFRTSAEPNCLR